MEPNEHPPTPPPESEFDRFRRFVKNLMGVPKSEVDALLAQEKARKASAAIDPPEPEIR